MFADERRQIIPQESKPEIQLSSGLTVRGGYQALDRALIMPACKIEPRSAMLFLRSSFDLAYTEQLLVAGAVHPLNPSVFSNPISTHPEFHTIPTEKIAAIREKRGKFTYIDDSVITHHPHIGNHVVTVAAVAAAVAEFLKLDTKSTERIVSLALLHDANKIPDMLVQRSGELRMDLKKFGIRPDHAVYDLLVKSGADTNGAERIADAGGNTGHSSLPRFLEATPQGKVQLKPGMLEQKIVHLADDMVSETAVLTTVERMVASNFAEKYEYLWKSGLSVAQGRSGPVLIETSTLPAVRAWSGMYADLQPLTSTAICAEILSLKGESSQNADARIKDVVGGILRRKNLVIE